MEFFKAVDFAGCRNWGEDVAERANAKLAVEIERWPLIYGQLPLSEFNWTGIKQWHDTHKARLVFIEEIPKQPCKHEPEEYNHRIIAVNPPVSYHDVRCKLCDVALVAEWKEKK